MRAFLLTFFCCTAILPALLFSQKYTTLNTAGGKAKSAYENGLQEARAGNALLAVGFFEKALKEKPDFIDAQLMWAGMHFELQDYASAETGFKKAVALDAAYRPEALFMLSQCAWQLDKFADAAAYAEQYLNNGKPDAKRRREAEKLIQNARFAATAIQKPVPFSPESVGDSINSAHDEYLPSLTADGATLIFTRRERGDENFFQSEKTNRGWQRAKPLEGVNTAYNEGAQHISADGSWLAFTACNRRGDGSQGSCDLYWSQFKNDVWTKPSPFSASINSAEWEAQPCISADGKSIYFASTRPGGQGGEDLWVTHRQVGGKWSAPENLGKNINTDGKEQTPFLHPDGRTLYFMSDGHPGMGGTDLYLSRRQTDGSWGAPENLGYPINTKKSEGALIVSLDGRTAWFAADRPGGRGGIDIYSFELPAHLRPQPATYVRARVTDASNGKGLVAKIEFFDLKISQLHTFVNTRSDGGFLVCLPAGKDYALSVSKEKYLFHSENFNLTEHASFEKPYLLDIALQPIADVGPSEAGAATSNVSKPVVLRNVFFETGSAALRPESTAELERLAVLLTETPALRIRINGHTDDVGDDAANLKLSELRAKAVHDFLLQKGIAPNRLTFKGFGETQPMAGNETPEDRGRNRRTEFEAF
jgi:outer membrane protein OmpA-like peptidoglycan-associated protein